jgi:type II secretory pathway pseudopilin PulG
MNSRKGLPISLGICDERGSVLIELVVATVIFAVVVASIAFYFVYHTGTINNGRAQLKLQRVGSLLMEEMARDLREGKRLQVETGDMVVGSVYSNLMVIPHDTSLKATRCFKFDDINYDIREGPDYSSLSPMKILDDSQTVGGDTRTHRIMCTALEFKREGDRVIIRFTLKHDLDNGPGEDDLDISFGSTVKLRG